MGKKRIEEDIFIEICGEICFYVLALFYFLCVSCE